MPDTPWPTWRRRLHEVIFEADTPAGQAFDVGLLACILLSVGAVLLESVSAVRAEHGRWLTRTEWLFTILFTIEYGLRLLAVREPWRYARSFFGIVDLLAIVPTYLSLVVAGTHSLIVIRALRLLRVFRVFKMAHFMGEARILRTALRASARKITVFVYAVLTIVLIVGALMYLLEGGVNPRFSSIPTSIYWAIVTLTTVGYGDVTPETVAGRVVASLVMILGYGIIAVPTGIVSVELAQASRGASRQACPTCGVEGHDSDARHCKYCGAAL